MSTFYMHIELLVSRYAVHWRVIEPTHTAEFILLNSAKIQPVVINMDGCKNFVGNLVLKTIMGNSCQRLLTRIWAKEVSRLNEMRMLI